MKKALLLLSICFTLILQAQVSKTIDISTAGELGDTLTAEEKSTITDLTITGTIDGRDFKVLRESMPKLTILDISAVTIAAYSSIDGTVTYPANTIPYDAFWRCSGLTSINIPSSCTSIGEHAFYNCKGLTSITIPSSVVSIGPNAFTWCTGLTSINIPSSVTSIGYNAFWYCRSLTSITIPISVTSLEGGIFYGCSGLTSINILYPITSISGETFMGCSSLTSFTIPSSVTSIGYSAFYGCSGLTSITIPSSVTYIGRNAFRNCSFISVNGKNTEYSSLDGVLFNKAKTTLIYCPTSKKGNYIIPSSVIEIDREAFYNCTELSSITVPSSVTSIGYNAFSYCSFISVDSTNSMYSSLDGVLFNKSKTNLIYYPASKKGSYIIPSSVVAIQEQAFSNCTGLTSITFPSSLSSIGYYAFGGCTALRSIYNYSNIPADLGGSVKMDYLSAYLDSCDLYVPKGRVDAYKYNSKWKYFKNIKEIPETSISGFNSNKNISFYPNPISDRVYLSGSEEITKIEIIDNAGRIVAIENGKTNSINTSNLNMGIYLVRVTTNNGVLVKKIIK